MVDLVLLTSYAEAKRSGFDNNMRHTTDKFLVAFVAGDSLDRLRGVKFKKVFLSKRAMQQLTTSERKALEDQIYYGNTPAVIYL
jgi:hypothetical protein